MTTSTTYENMPINLLIANLSSTKQSPISYDDLKVELNSKDDHNNPKYYLSLKEDDNLCMIFNNPTPDNDTRDPQIVELEKSCKSIILDKSNLKPIVSQYNKILYNEEAITFLKDKPWTNVCVQKCYEGTLIIVFNHNNNWYVTTRRCLNAKDSTWVRNNSYYDMFVEAMENKFTFDELNKEYCYHFILVHHKNRNIVNYGYLGHDYKELFHISTTEKYTLKEIVYKINDNVKYIQEDTFSSIDDLINELKKQDEQDKKKHRVTFEGYILKYYTGIIHESPFVTLKLQTDIYETLMKLKPNNSNLFQCYLELYQKDKLNEFLPYFTKYGIDVIKRIHGSMQTLSKEMLDLYHMTRGKKNEEIYNNLTNQYKKCLYEIHGMYVKNRSRDFVNGVDVMQEKMEGNIRSINVFDIYKYLKNLPFTELRQIYHDRIKLSNDSKNTFINKNCTHTMTQSTLMFKNDKTN